MLCSASISLDPFPFGGGVTLVDTLSCPSSTAPTVITAGPLQSVHQLGRGIFHTIDGALQHSSDTDPSDETLELEALCDTINGREVASTRLQSERDQNQSTNTNTTVRCSLSVQGKLLAVSVVEKKDHVDRKELLEAYVRVSTRAARRSLSGDDGSGDGSGGSRSLSDGCSSSSSAGSSSVVDQEAARKEVEERHGGSSLSDSSSSSVVDHEVINQEAARKEAEERHVLKREIYGHGQGQGQGQGQGEGSPAAGEEKGGGGKDGHDDPDVNDGEHASVTEWRSFLVKIATM